MCGVLPARNVTELPAESLAPPTSASDGCWDSGKFYKPGDYISYHPCYFTQCTQDGIIIGDVFCDDDGECNYESPPNDCCPACRTSTIDDSSPSEVSTTRAIPTTTKETTTTTKQAGCWYYGKFYKEGDYIYKNPCNFSLCTNDGLQVGGDLCDTDDGCNKNESPTACCPACQKSTTEEIEPSTTSTIQTTSPAGCWQYGYFYQVGEYIYKTPCYFALCTEDGILYGDDFCDTRYECNTHRPPTECCPACQTPPPSIWSPPESSTPESPDISTTPAGCWDNGTFYKPGDYIYKTPCNFKQCTDSGIAYGDEFCDTGDKCNRHKPPTECCPACQASPSGEWSPAEGSTLETPDIPTTTPAGCWDNGKFYKPGDYISQHPCYFAQCTENGIIVGDEFCDTNNQCNTNEPPTECCPACPTREQRNLGGIQVTAQPVGDTKTKLGGIQVKAQPVGDTKAKLGGIQVKAQPVGDTKAKLGGIQVKAQPVGDTKAKLGGIQVKAQPVGDTKAKLGGIQVKAQPVGDTKAKLGGIQVKAQPVGDTKAKLGGIQVKAQPVGDTKAKLGGIQVKAQPVGDTKAKFRNIKRRRVAAKP
ncbi:hypothetical protein BsWGS_12085 [Bradybaena similaris]